MIQRGNNRAACFFGDVDRLFYLKCLKRAAGRTGCSVHAYVLMTNHVHLLVTPTVPGAIAAMLQEMGRRYVRVINTLHGRTGTLWEGRFKSSLISTEKYLLACHRYIELNPVRAGIALAADAYPWSSHAHYALGRTNPIVTEHATFLSLGATDSDRQAAFRKLFDQELAAESVREIRDAINAGCALGAQLPKRGRPPKKVETPSTVTGNLF